MSNKEKTSNNKAKQETRVLWRGNIIILRGRKGAKGESLYLDYQIEENGKKLRKYEFLSKLALLKKNSRDTNKENLKTAIEEAKLKDTLLLKGEYSSFETNFDKVDFVAYCESYSDKYKKNDSRMINATIKQFKKFMETNKIKSLQGKDINENLVYQYKEYLLNDSGLSGESPNSYLRRFKKILKQAQRDKVVNGEPGKDITIKLKKTFKKDVLTIEELQKLKATPCKNDIIKRAFLFSTMTGLRFVDVKNLLWKNIDNGIMKIVQEKTEIENSINLNKTALDLIGDGANEKKESKIFNLPSFEYCMRILKKWKTDAGINKHITWHVARHSFGTNLLIAGTDVKTTAGLLGHTDLHHVNRYLRVVEKLKEEATNKLEL